MWSRSNPFFSELMNWKKYSVERGQQKHWQAVDYAYYKNKQQMLLSQFS